MKKLAAVLLALVLALMLIACGGNNNAAESVPEADNTGDTGNTNAADVTESGADADDGNAGNADEAGELKLVSPGKLTVSLNAAFPPYEMTTDAGGFEGIDVDIAGLIAEKLGLELRIDDMDFDAALLAVQNGKSDIVMSGVSVTEARLAVMDFSDSYATGIQSVIVPEGSDVNIDNLGDHMIATQRATTGNIYCSDEFGDEHVLAYDNGMTAIQALLNGQADCVVIDDAPARAFVSQNPGLTILDTEYAVEDYAIGIGKGNTNLLNAINGALAELKADGSVQAVIDKYISAE